MKHIALSKSIVCVILFLFIGAGVIPCLHGKTIPSSPSSLDASRQIGGGEQKKLLDNFASASLFFTQNQGQFPAEVLFQTHVAGATVYLYRNKIVTVFTRESSSEESLDLKDNSDPVMNCMLVHEPQQSEMISTVAEFVGANPDVVITGEHRLLHCNNYFIGNDPLKWYTDVPNYQGVTYHDVYPGVDLTYYGEKGGGLKYDFIVHPGANASRIQVRYTGVDGLSIAQDGALRVETRFGVISENIPFVYQKVDGVAHEVQGRYVIREAGVFGFAIDGYNPAFPLVIDPVLVYSTYLGGSAKEEGMCIAVDDSKYAYVVGTTYSVDFPVKNPYDGTYNGNGWGDVFVSKFSTTGKELVYSTYIGGSGDDFGYGIAVDESGNAYVTGNTDSDDFPVENPYDGNLSYNDAFVSKLSPSGNTLVYSTYLGGNGYEEGYGIAVDESGNAYVTGNTDSDDFPVENPYDGNLSYYDAFVSKLSPSGNTLVYSTYLGGSDGETGYSITVDSSENVYILGKTFSVDFPVENPYDGTYNGGSDAFVSKLSPSGNTLVYSTYLGGSDDESWWFGNGGIAVDGSGNAYVTGMTYSFNFPVVNPYDGSLDGWNDVFISKLSPTGETLVYSTYFGGSSQEFGYDIAVNDSGDVYVVGATYSDDFPVKNPYDGTYNGWCDVFISKLSTTENELVYSTYFGGYGGYQIGQGIAVDDSGDAYVTGITKSDNFPMMNSYDSSFNGGYDAFVSKLSPEINEAPDKPAINGRKRGKVGVEYEYTFSISDPDGDLMHIRIDWGSGVPGKWDGPYPSGTILKLNHSWDKKASYNIRAQIQDIYGLQSEWGTFEVTMARNIISTNSIIMRLFERFPNLFPIIRQLLGL